MLRIAFVTVLLALSSGVFGQIFYYTTFPDTITFPTGWSPSDSRIALSSQAQSGGYTEPPASSGANVRFNDCLPISQTIRLTVNGVINTVNKSNLRVGFGRRISSAWDNPVAFEWSSNGSSWNLISNDVSDGASTNWSSIYFDLPAATENQTNLRFRFSFTTTFNVGCLAARNFRIDDFAVGDNFSLPVELMAFDAVPIENRARLTWSTASETSSDYFAIERSTDGRAFHELGQVRGAGTTREPRHYSYWDDTPTTGTNYFRLRQVDRDGAFSYSQIRIVEIGRGFPFHIFPSPVHDQLNVRWIEPNVDEQTTWEVFDLCGRLLLQQVAPLLDGETVHLPVQSLQPGLHFLRVTSSRQSWTKNFTKY